MSDQIETSGNQQEKGWNYQPASEEEKARLASALIGNAVFSSQHIPMEDANLVGSIFLPFGLGGLADVPAEELNRINPVLYEYLDKAAPSSINGYPCFFSMKLIAWDEWLEVLDRVASAREALKPKA